MLFRLILSFLCIIFVSQGTLLFGDVALSAEPDKKSIYMDDRVVLTIIIASEGEKLSKPVVSQFKGFSANRISNSTYFSSINGIMTYNTKMIYRLIPKKEGQFHFPPVTVVANGKKYHSNPIVITVKKGLNPSPKSSISGLTKPRIVNRNTKNLVQDEKEDVAFVVSQVDKKECFENEQIILTVSFNRRVPILGDLLYAAPELEGFWSEKVYPHKTSFIDRGYFRFRSTKIRTILFPAREGTFDIGSARIDCHLSDHDRGERSFLNVDNFFDSLQMFHSGQKVSLRTKPIKIKVKPLPKEGKPDNFSGAVGIFQIAIKSDKKEIEFGDAMNVKISIAGKGRLKGAHLPHIDQMPDVQIFPAQPVYQEKQRLNLELFSRYDQEFAVIPQKDGSITIPSIHFSYFDPEKKQYCLSKTKPLLLTIKPSQKTFVQNKIMNFDSSSHSKEDQYVEKKILRYFKRSFPRNKKLLSWIHFKSILLFVFFFPLFLFLLTVFSHRIRDSFALLFLKRKKILIFKKDMQKVRGHMLAKRINLFYIQSDILLKKCFSLYLSNIKKNSTVTDIERVLQSRNVTPLFLEKVKAFMDKSDHIRFSGVIDNDSSLEEDWKNLQYLLAEIERLFEK